MPVDRRAATVPPNRAARRHRRWASIREAAGYVHVHERTIRNMIAQGRLTAYRSGPRLIRVDLDELDAAMREAS